MKKQFFRICSTVLIIVLLINMLPMSIFAEEFRESITTEIKQPDTSLEMTAHSDAQIVGEIPSKRTQYSKEFILSNGLHLAAVYPDAVHYEEDGSWEEIDNTLMLKNGKYVNTAGVWNVSFPQQLSDSKSVTIEKDGYTLSFAMAGELRSTGLEIASTVGGENAASIKESVMQVFENTVVEEDTPMDVTSSTLAVTVPETVPEDTVSVIEETEPKATTEVSVPETTISTMETEPEIIEPLPEVTVPTEVEMEQIITDVMPEQLTVSQMQLSTATVQALDKAALQESYQYAEMAPEKLYSRLSYANVYQNTDVIYDMDSNRVKESIVMEAYSNTLRGYKYTLNVGQMIPVLEEDGQILFYDADQKNVVMVMPAPYLVDASEESNYDIKVQLTGGNGIYTLTYLLPTQWLAAPERAWPVILDPVVAANLNKSNIRDHTVSRDGNLNYQEDFLEVGRNEKRGISRIFLKYRNLPQLTSSDVIVGASIQLYKKVAGTQIQVNVHKVQGTWESETLNWSNKPNYNSTIEDYALVGAAGDYTWNVTDIVRDWYTNQNTGMMFKATDAVEQGSNYYYKHFYSSDQSDIEKRPILAIMFRNNNGLESYWDYTSSSAGRAGTGYINNYTGNLTWIREDIGFGGNRMPVSIQHVYNLNDAIVPSDNNNSNDSGGNSFGMGYGWRTNYNQSVYHWETNSITDSDYYIWEDSDGTDHYFKYSSENTYKDEDGLKLTLTRATNGSYAQTYTITDEDGNKSFFDGSGRLTKIENNQATPSSIVITYVPDTRWIATITDGANRKYSFHYNDNLLRYISYKGIVNEEDTEEDDEEISRVTFIYENEKLTKITDNDGNFSKYTYSGFLLWTAEDVDGYRLTYRYNTIAGSWQPYRVLSVAERDTVNEVDGGKLTFAYGHNQTTITDYNGNTEIHQFNDFGNTRSIQDDEGHATFADYSRNNKDDTAGKANQLRLSSKLQNTVGNLINDSSFENGTLWTPQNSTSIRSINTTHSYHGSKSMHVRGGVNGVEFTIAKGDTYTLSVYAKTGDIGTIGIKVGGTIVSQTEIPYETDWARYEVSYTNQGLADVQATLFLDAQDQQGAYFDCVQLEKAPTPSRYNLIENGDFVYSSNNWTKSVNCTTVDTHTTLSAGKAPATQLQNTVFQISGDAQKTKSIQQTVVVSGQDGDSIVLAGWAKGRSAPISDNRKFALRAWFNYTDGSDPVYFDAEFNTAVDQWQYVAAPMVANKNYTSITVAAVYDYNVNTVYFDGIQLYKEEFGSSYTYDANGNVTSVVDLQKKNITYEYNSNGDITKILENNKAKVTYTYDSWHNVLTATTDEDVVYNFEYDTYGNNTKVTIGSGTTISSQAFYADEGNRLDYTVDALGKITRYGYDPNTNELKWVQYPEDTVATRTNYTYDDMYRMARAECTTSDEDTMYADYYYEGDNLIELVTPTACYHFEYGAFGLMTQAGPLDSFFANYTYDLTTHNLEKLDYGNGDSVEYTYDKKGRLLTQKYEYGETITYTYDNNGNLATVKDSDTGRTTTYYYDLTDRLIKYVEKGSNYSSYSHSVSYEYDTKNNLTQQVEEINGTKRTTSYAYDDDNRVTSVTTDGTTVTYTYDSYGRVTQQVTKNGSTTVLTESYTYVNPTAATTSSQIASYTTTASNGYSVTYTYTYDDNGNILTITEGENTITYTYDSANQLTGETNSATGTGGLWEYDGSGNITSAYECVYDASTQTYTPVEEHEYQYDEGTSWRDTLNAYDGQSIPRDGIGNPILYRGCSFEWIHGRQLFFLYNGESMWIYEYNADGMRVAKYGDYETYEYVYNGSQLMQMSNDTDTLNFTYDASGTPLTVKYNGTTYYYATNIQGDIVAILDASGTAVVSYAYDAWGNILSTTGNAAATLGDLNPLRYRGYVFDQETGLYYLQSRYYAPTIGRFLNADAFTSTGQGLTGNNMFAYCGNNPVMNIDSEGTRYHAVKSLGDKQSKYIFDQTAAPYGTKEFQDVTVSYGGCGVVASYNALITLGSEKDFDEVLAYYNGDPNRTFMRGKLGILPGQVANYFESLGYRTITTNSVDGIDVLSKQADACIMFYIFPTQQDVCGIGLTLPAAHFVEYKYYSNQYIGRNTSATNGTSYFKYPSEYFYKYGRVYAEAVLIFK